MPIYLKAATSALEKDCVFKLRRKVFVEEECRFEHSSDRILDFYDAMEESANFIACEDGEVVGSLRVTIQNDVGLPAFDHYDFRPLMEAKWPDLFANIGWLCVSKKYRSHRGLLPALFKMAVRESKKKGAKHLIAPLHPPLLPLLKRFGARAIDKEFFSEEMGVSMVPIHVDFNDLPPGLREFSQDPATILFGDSNERRIYRQGEKIIQKGEMGSEAFLIMRGAVELVFWANPVQTSIRGYQPIGENVRGNPLLGQGQVFGIVALLDDGPRTADVIGYSKEVDVMVWDRSFFAEQLRSGGNRAVELCKILANRLRCQIEGYREDESHEALIATIALDASVYGEEDVDLVWLAGQCAVRIKEMEKIMEGWAKEGIVLASNGHAIKIVDIRKLRNKSIWR